ncbi:MAG: DUF2148 domain-containing protein [Bacillota bacterium]
MTEQNAKMQEILETVAGLMALAARTAPKAKGKDFLEIKVLKGEMLQYLADGMVRYAQQSNKPPFARDGENVRRSEIVLLLSLHEPQPTGLNCGACGFARCSDLKEQKNENGEFTGPVCTWRQLDLGIALGSAVKTASLHNADNRMMYTIGAVARALKLIEGNLVVGIPLSATGKNIFFDR